MSNQSSVDSGDYEWDPSQKTATAWSTRVMTKAGRTRRTYSRRGSTGDGITRRPSEMARAATLPATLAVDEEHEGFSLIDDLAFGSENFDRTSCNLLGHSWQESSSRAPPQRAGRFTRAHSLSLSSFSHVPERPMHRRSFSVSSRTNSYSTEVSENLDPNLDPSETKSSPKRGATLDSDDRGRKKVRSTGVQTPLSNMHGSHSFSHLARSGEEGLSWARTPSEGSTFPKVLGTESGGYQTDSSPTTKSIGSCRKRGVCGSPIDDMDDVTMGGFTLGKPPHTRTRSGIFSPPTSRLSMFSLSNDDEKKDRTDLASDDGVDTDPDSRERADSVDDASIESDGIDGLPMPSLAAQHFGHRRRAAIGGFTEPNSQPANLSEPDEHENFILRSMSSYKDLQFLVRVLRKQRSGSFLSWHVAPPLAWVSGRRALFFRWTETLGFTIRAGGMGLSYLQIPISKGGEVLRLLESALAKSKAQGMGQTLPELRTTPARDKLQMMDIATSSKKRAPASAGKTSNTPKELIPLNSVPSYIRNIPESNFIDDDLVNLMMSLGVDESPQEDSRNAAPVCSSIIFEEDDLSQCADLSRPSMENHASARDLMFHMQGMSPVRSKPRRPRLSNQSLGSVGTGYKHVTASPFPQAPISATAFNSHKKSLTFDFVETPMMKQAEPRWGSCPVGGRDWGTSECCNDTIIKELQLRFRRVCAAAGSCTSPFETGPSDLGFDLEAASRYREQEESPTSASNCDDVDDAGLFEDTLADSPAVASYSTSNLPHFDNVVQPSSMYNGMDMTQIREMRRRLTSFAKHKRMSLIAAVKPTVSIVPTRKSLFTRPLRGSFVPSEIVFFETLAAAPIFPSSQHRDWEAQLVHQHMCPVRAAFKTAGILGNVLCYLHEHELLRIASLVCSSWSDTATHAHANLMLMSVGCTGSNPEVDDESEAEESAVLSTHGIPGLLERPWTYLTNSFPWGRFLSEGAFKRVYKVFNQNLRVCEAVSVMDVEAIASNGNMDVVGTELAVAVMLSSLVRRGVCPNYILTRGVFSCPYEPSYWGSAEDKYPQGETYVPSKSNRRKPREPKQQGRYQYIRMELCDEGDVEEYLKRQPDKAIPPDQARQFLFQISFALHAAAARFSMKHYDVKLLNIFLKRPSPSSSGDVVMRYGLGAHKFALRAPAAQAMVAKLADYGTANVEAQSSGQAVTIAQFTTLENTPPEFLMLGDLACQGHGHDCFGLGLCMLHLFTGHAPYEEILVDVKCPKNLRRKLGKLWEDENVTEFSVVRSIVLQEVFKDDDGHILEGDPDETLYDTLYRYLVLFGVPDEIPNSLGGKVVVAIKEALYGSHGPRARGRKGGRGKNGLTDVISFSCDRKKYSLSHGNNEFIARARASLKAMDGGMELMMSLVSFHPQQRASALDVLNSSFMAPLRETPGVTQLYNPDDTVYSYAAFST